MYLFHLTVHVQPSKAESFIRLHGEITTAIRQSPGFLRRILLRDKEHAGTFFYISVWQSLADLDAYRASPACKLWAATLEAADVFAAPPARVECDMIYDDVVADR